MQAAQHLQRHPWLDRLIDDPAAAVDSLLQGYAYLPGLQRVSPCEALMALMGDLQREAPEWQVLDQALLAWLRQRRQSIDGLLERPGGSERFIRETGEAFRSAWRLDLPDSSDWIRANQPDLLRWAENFTINATFDLGRAVMTAGAHLQRGEELRFQWFRICEEAARPRLRHRLDVAMMGLSRLAVKGVGGPSNDVLAGLARWAVRLPEDDRYKSEVVREWRALKAAFPRQPTFWRSRWEAILNDSRYDHAFIQWLKDADPVLSLPSRTGQPKREPLLPKNILGLIEDFEKEVDKDGLTQSIWLRIKQLLEQLERFAELTGNNYYLVTSCTSIAKIILPFAPGHALIQARRALLWAPSDGHAWSVRARALEQLGMVDLATSVLWEGMRRAPMSTPISNQLAILLIKSGRNEEAQSLLRQAVPDRFDEVILYKLSHLLIAQGCADEAAEYLNLYCRHFDHDEHSALLQRLIDAGPTGQENAYAHFMTKGLEPKPEPLSWDIGMTQIAIAEEEGESAQLEGIARVSRADLMFRMGGDYHETGLKHIDGVIDFDDSNAYAQVVKSLAIPEYRETMEGRLGRFAGSLPVQLAVIPRKASPERWHALGQRFPEGKPLIDLVRLAHGDETPDTRIQLIAWTETKSRWDEGWAEFLKKKIADHLSGKRAANLDSLAHDALTQAVDVGWSITAKVA